MNPDYEKTYEPEIVKPTNKPKRTFNLITNPNGKNGVTGPIKFACVIEVDGKYLDQDVLVLTKDEAYVFSTRTFAKKACKQLKKLGFKKVEIIDLTQEEITAIIMKNKEVK